MVVELDLCMKGKFQPLSERILGGGGVRGGGSHQGVERSFRDLGDSTVDDSVLVINLHVPADDSLSPDMVGVTAFCHTPRSLCEWIQMLRVT